MKIKNWIILFLAIITLSFFSGRLSSLGERNAQNQALMHLNDSITVYSVTIGELEQTVYEKQQLILSHEQAVALGILEQDRLKKLNLRKGAQVTRIEGQLIAARDSIPLGFELHPIPEIPIEGPSEGAPGETKNTVQLPVSFTFTEQYLKLNAGIGINKQGWFDLTAPTPLVVTLGDRRDGLFKSSPTITVTTQSPYITVTNLESVDTRKIKWYQKWWLPAGTGFGVGLVSYYLISGFFE